MRPHTNSNRRAPAPPSFALSVVTDVVIEQRVHRIPASDQLHAIRDRSDDAAHEHGAATDHRRPAAAASGRRRQCSADAAALLHATQWPGTASAALVSVALPSRRRRRLSCRRRRR